MSPVKEIMPEILGGIADRIFLSIPAVIGLFKGPRMVSRAGYEAEMDFYFDEGHVESPDRFFTFPEETPEHTVIKRSPYLGGEYQVVSFSSAYETRNPLLRERYAAYEENKTGYLIRWTHGRPGAKTVLCLHGYLLGSPRQNEKLFKTAKLFSRGLDVALFVTPFHWKRSPAAKSKKGIFLQPDDVTMTCECFGQAMFDLTSAIRILERMGAGPTGLMGASLGGYLAALYACLGDGIEFASMVVPSVSLDKPIGPEKAKLPFPVDEPLLEKMRKIYTLHSPLHFTPKIPKQDILITASRGDLVCPFENILLLCERWGWPEHHFLRGGHWLIFNNEERGRAWYAFLQKKGFLVISP